MVKRPEICATQVKGFTLIEILTVVVIVGLIGALIVVNIERDGSKIAFLEAKKFSSLLALAKDESILLGLPMGVSLSAHKDTYQFMVFKNGWEESDDYVFRERELPKLIEVVSNISNAEESELDEDEEGPRDPDVVITPDGLISSFEIVFSSSDTKLLVAPDIDQNIIISDPNEAL